MGSILVTGAAGFIGGHVVDRLLARGERVVGLDSFDPYYDPTIKRANVARLAGQSAFSFHELDVRQGEAVQALVAAQQVDRIIHLAALAGVRASIERAGEYEAVNVGGTIHLLDAARHSGVTQFVLASTSSVYGDDTPVPFVESGAADRPMAPYPASKRAAEMMAYSYHHLFGLNVTCARLFTVYGPRVRPDMMLYLVAEFITHGTPVTMFGDGSMRRDWTYVGDIADGLVLALDRPLGYDILNLGRGEPVLLADFVGRVQQLAGRAANLVHKPAPPSEPPITFADISKARRLLGYEPQVSVEQGLALFWDWYSAKSRAA